jgi:hypothetical protein
MAQVNMQIQKYLNDLKGSIELDALLTVTSGATVVAISFVNTTSATNLSITYSQIATTNTYNVRMVPVDPAASLIGKYVIEASIVFLRIKI